MATGTDILTGTDRSAPAFAWVKPLVAVVGGVGLLVLAFALLDRISGWADQYGAIWVYLGFFVFMSIAGRLFWYGIDELKKQITR
ncbi:hypothetical protein [Nocardia brasiliensis]